MLVSEQQFIQPLIKRYEKHNNSTDGGTWYPQACTFLNVKRHNHHSSKEKASQKVQYIKDRTGVLTVFTL